MSLVLDIATKAAYVAANVIQKHSRIALSSTNTSSTMQDMGILACESMLDIVKRTFPEHNILSKDLGAINKSSEYTWILNPLDGAANFLHNNPQYSVSLALQHNDEITHAVILDPNRNDLYKAELGRGAYLNDRRIRVSKINHIANSLLGSEFPIHNVNYVDNYLKALKDILHAGANQHRTGSVSLDLAYVAAGYLDGFWGFGLSVWNIAPGHLIIKEAGGIVEGIIEHENILSSNGVVAANPHLVKALLYLTREHLTLK